MAPIVFFLLVCSSKLQQSSLEGYSSSIRAQDKLLATDINFLRLTFINVVLQAEQNPQKNFQHTNKSNTDDRQLQVGTQILGPQTHLLGVPDILGCDNKPDNIDNLSEASEPEQEAYGAAIKMLVEEHTQHQQEQHSLYDQELGTFMKALRYR